MYPVLDYYQQEGFHELISIAGQYHGAFVCDGVGLGKTFIGLMLIEYLIKKHRKRARDRGETGQTDLSRDDSAPPSRARTRRNHPGRGSDE